MKKIILALTTCSLIFACKQQEKDSVKVSETSSKEKVASVIQPLKGLETPTVIFKINPSVDNNLKTAYGGEVKIPANSIVDANGKQISGEVEIVWKEYHTLTDILFSGIPMKYDSAGVARDLISGGMFSINAFQNGENLAINKNKSIDVNLGSISDTPCYNFYEMDTTTGVWTYETTANGVKVADNNSSNSSPEAEAQVSKPRETILEGKLNTADFPEFQNKRIIGWKTSDKIDAKTKNMLENINTLRSLDKVGNTYVLNLEQKQNSEVLRTNLNVTPYTLEDAQKDKPAVQKQVDNLYEKLFAFHDRKANAIYARAISITNFGLYNWDVCYDQPNLVTVNARLDYPDMDDMEKSLMRVYFISPKENRIVEAKSRGGLLKIAQQNDAILVAINPDHEVFVIKKEEVRKWKEHGVNYSAQADFQKTKITLSEENDLTEYLTQLF